MQFIRPFQNFDPIKGKLHKKTPPVVKNYLKIAREIVVNRDYDEIEYAITTINYLLHGGRELLVNSDLNNEEEITDKEIEITSIEESWDLVHSENKHFTPSSLLYGVYCQFDIEIDNQEDFKNANWAEYFSVLALAEIAEFQESDVPSMHPVELSSRSAEIAESIAFAKTFVELNNLESRLSRHVLSLKGRKAAIERHKENHDLKLDFTKWYDENYSLGKEESEINFSEAARQFYRLKIRPIEKHETGKPYEYDEGTLRMLKTALREYRKAQSKT